MNTEKMIVEYESDAKVWEDRGGKVVDSAPGVHIRLDFLPGEHRSAEKALDRAVAHVKGRLVDPDEADDVG